jgi:hypothetical protein
LLYKPPARLAVYPGFVLVSFSKEAPTFGGGVSLACCTSDSYPNLMPSIIGIRKESVQSSATAKDALQLMQELHIDSVPVLDSIDRWLFFANREEILARLMTSILVD